MNVLRAIICGLEVPKSCRHYLVTHLQSKWLSRKFSETLRINITVTVRIINGVDTDIMSDLSFSLSDLCQDQCVDMQLFLLSVQNLTVV
jgi:hypothetical protein